MTKKIILTLGSVILLASSLSAKDIRYERDYKKSHKQVKRDFYKDSHYLSRAEKREIRRMREMKRERMQEQRRRLEAQQRRLEMRERRLEHERRRYEARSRQHEINKVATIINLATLPIIIHDMHMRELAMIRDRY